MIMKKLGVLSILTALLLAPLAADDAPKPNVLFIAVDDLNDHISPLDNYPGVRTPNLDRWQNVPSLSRSFVLRLSKVLAFAS